MPVELRKRKAHQQPQASAPLPKKTKSTAASNVSKAAEKVKKAVTPKASAKKAVKRKEAAETEENGEPTPAKDEGKPKPQPKRHPNLIYAPGDVLALEGFGGDIETNDGVKTSLKELVDKSKAGVVLFTYPKASTPGCTCP